jgi:hypothetical protein
MVHGGFTPGTNIHGYMYINVLITFKWQWQDTGILASVYFMRRELIFNSNSMSESMPFVEDHECHKLINIKFHQIGRNKFRSYATKTSFFSLCHQKDKRIRKISVHIQQPYSILPLKPELMKITYTMVTIGN